MTDAAHIAALEDRIAKLEAAAVLFEEHRQSWERFCKSTKELEEQWKRDDAERKQRELEAGAKRSKSLWDQLHPVSLSDHQPPLDQTMELLRFLNEDRYLRREIERGFADLKRGLAELTVEIRKLNATDTLP
jgi:hypothetical protein